MSKVKEEIKADLQKLLDDHVDMLSDYMPLATFDAKLLAFLEKWGIIDDRREP